MKANELRIGNIFRDKYTRMMIIVIGLTDNEITFSGEFDSEWQAEPIPLTEQRLLKFGFEWKNHAIRLGKYAIRQQVDGWFMYLSNESLNFTIHLKYVHQLQNLYFALTGKELTI